MKLTKCEIGHFFDADAYEACPHCAGCIEPETETELDFGDRDYGDDPSVVGWLVCVDDLSDHYYGERFPLKNGRNTIGRRSECSVSLDLIWADILAVIVCDPISHKYMAMSDDSKGFDSFKVNNRIVIEPVELNRNDVLRLEHVIGWWDYIDLLFMPLY